MVFPHSQNLSFAGLRPQLAAYSFAADWYSGWVAAKGATQAPK
jgi:hypothetical protein